MSWNISMMAVVNKVETLAAFDRAVDADVNAEPKQVLKDSVRALCAHMGDKHVRMIRCYGHTNPNGENCTVGITINS